MKIVNLCQNDLKIRTSTGEIRDFPKAEKPAKVSETSEVVRAIGPFDIHRLKFGKVQNLPDPEPGTFYIVPRIVAATAKEEGRDIYDLIIPGRGIRNSEGRVIVADGFDILS